ncbi:hypothetical protein ACFXPX_21545 [Kitasatospora sp. NPDC059146]|uniref:hypothetical protein n=1 Tax=Kitasatospora sp. NPDC059146 TaxID=3346741 RepID=UPI0036A10AF2
MRQGGWAHSTNRPPAPATRDELRRLSDRYQPSLDRDDPGGPSPWTPERWESFRTATDAALAALRHDLGAAWTVTDRRS